MDATTCQLRIRGDYAVVGPCVRVPYCAAGSCHGVVLTTAGARAVAFCAHGTPGNEHGQPGAWPPCCAEAQAPQDGLGSAGSVPVGQAGAEVGKGEQVDALARVEEEAGAVAGVGGPGVCAGG